MSLQRLSLFKNNIFSLSPLFEFVKRHKSFRKLYKEFWTPKPINVPPYEHFVQVGDPTLRCKAAPVPEELIKSEEVQLIIEKMVKVLHKYECVGVAAPQIGVSLRIIVMEFGEKASAKYTKEVYEARKMSTLPLTILINPNLKVTNYQKYKHLEGCMSVRGYIAETERYAEIVISGIDKNGAPTELKLSGWNARIAQHEMDHLDGKLYIDHMDRSTFCSVCWEAVNAKCGRIEIPFYK